MYTILLNNGNIPCNSCHGTGTFIDSRGRQRVCKFCSGSAKVQIRDESQKIIQRLRPLLRRLPMISNEHSLMLRFTDAEDCLLCFNSLHYYRLKAKLIIENNPS